MQTRWLVLGVCSVNCDPLPRDCPENFACSLAEGGSGAGEPVPFMFACLPVFRSNPVGRERSSGSQGECAPGSTCIHAYNDPTCDDPNAACAPANCRAYCDTGEDDACPESQTCQRLDYFPEGSPVGFCAE